MSFQTNNMNARLGFENAKAALAGAGYTLDDAVLTPSELRSEIVMSTSVTNYNVPVLITDTNNQINTGPYLTEARLALQDVFIINAIGLFIGIPASNTVQFFELYTYPNPNVWTTSGAAAALYALYNGKLNLSINQRQILVNWPLYRHYQVNQTQGGVGVTAQTIFPIDEFDGTTDAFFPCEPLLVLPGSGKIQFTINLPAAISTLQASTSPRIVVRMAGYLGQNATSVNNS